MSKWDDGLIVVDDREKRPYWPEATRCRLVTGDYSLTGLEDVVAVERKSVADIYGSVAGKGGVRRARLLREFRRLSRMKYPALVVEGMVRDIYHAKRWGRVSPAVVLGTLHSWASAYRIPVWMAAGRDGGRVHCLYHLRMAWEDINRRKPSAHLEDICPCGGGTTIGHMDGCISSMR